MADRELEILRDALREHVNALAVDIGPRTPLNGDSLIRAASYIRSVFEATGLLVTEQDYQYHGQRVTNLLATTPKAAEASAYYLVGAHYDTVPGTPGADDNGRQCKCRCGIVRIGQTLPQRATEGSCSLRGLHP